MKSTPDFYDQLIDANPHLKEFIPLLDTHNNESHRGKVLVACSFIDKQLGDMIKAFLIEDSEIKDLLEGQNAPLGSFSSRIKMAHSLGLISNNEKKTAT